MEYRKIDASNVSIDSVRSPGPAPMLDWLPVGALVIDDGYQRELSHNSWTHIRAIAKAFTWSKFSPVFVAPIEGGRYAIIDGQHRTHAAAARGFKQVPCQIVQMDRAEQASAFSAVNGDVTAVSLFQIYRSALVAGDAWAVDCRAAVEAAGCVLATSQASSAKKKPGEIYSIGMVAKLVEAGKAQSLTMALQHYRASESGSSLAYLWSNTFLGPYLNAVLDQSEWLAGEWLPAAVDAADFLKIVTKAESAQRDCLRRGSTPPPKGRLISIGMAMAFENHAPQMQAAE